MAGRKRVAITGDPGTAWTNSTATCQWQLIVNWRNSCGRCVQYDRQIAVAWGIPFHYGCVCRSLPVWPGETAQPFVDFREKIQTLDPIEQSRVMGRSNLTLVQAGVLTWDDVITRSRILDLHESVAKHRLTVDQMVKAGVDPYQRRRPGTPSTRQPTKQRLRRRRNCSPSSRRQEWHQQRSRSR